MANYRDFIDKKVYLSQLQYEKKMIKTKEQFIKYLKEHRSIKEFTHEQIQTWYNINHRYMEQSIDELINKVRDDNHITMKEQQNIKNFIELESIDKFIQNEKLYANRISEDYVNNFNNPQSTEMEYLTEKIKHFDEYEKVKPYFKNGLISSMHTIAEYNSMLFNTNLKLASWNETFKDAEILDNDLVVWESHPNACSDCLEHMGKIYSLNGKTPGYPVLNIEDQSEIETLTHPNCKCNLSLFWRNEQLDNQLTEDQKYDEVQKAKALDREIRKQNINYKLYNYIENYDEADKTLNKVNALESKFEEIINVNDIGKYFDY